MSFAGTYFDGLSIGGRRVDVDVMGDLTLVLKDGDYGVVVPGGTYSFSGPLESIPRFALLPGGVLEVPSTGEANAALSVFAPSGPLDRAETWLGARIRIAAGIAAALVASGLVFVFAGLPAMARRIAFAVPSPVEEQIGLASQTALKGYVRDDLVGSDGAAEHRAKTQLSYLKAARRLHVDPTLIVVNLAQANAFALPGGTIVVTTGLLRIGLSDEEMAAILAHELGHEELRHGLQSILRQSSALIVVSLMTGDLATLTTFSSSLPLLLLTRGYSRDFEREADAFSVDLLKVAGMDPAALAGALEKLEKASEDKTMAVGYLSTHPNTAERIAAIRSSFVTFATIAPTDFPWLLRRAHVLYPSNSQLSVGYFKTAFKLRTPDAEDLYAAAVSAAYVPNPSLPASAPSRDDAFKWLAEAIRRGLKDPKAKLDSPLLDSLHSDPRWALLRFGN